MKANILIVEDEEALTLLLRYNLEAEGYGVETVPRGDEADLLPLGRRVSPGAALLSPRGPVLENGRPRFFRRLSEGVFDADDVRRRAGDLSGFVAAARAAAGSTSRRSASNTSATVRPDAGRASVSTPPPRRCFKRSSMPRIFRSRTGSTVSPRWPRAGRAARPPAVPQARRRDARGRVPAASGRRATPERSKPPSQYTRAFGSMYWISFDIV